MRFIYSLYPQRLTDINHFDTLQTIREACKLSSLLGGTDSHDNNSRDNHSNGTYSTDIYSNEWVSEMCNI